MIDSGVYKISSVINGLVYIGSSISLKKRIARHKRELKNGIHKNKLLQSHYNKYGDVFVYTIELRITGSIDIIRDYENYYISFYKAAEKKYGFNIMKDSVSWLGFKHTEESKAKCRLAAIKQSEQTRKGVLGICPETGEIIKKFKSVSEARLEFPGCAQVLAKKCYYSGGLIWIFEKDLDSFNVSSYNNVYTNSRFKSNSRSHKPILDLETGVYYDNMKDAADALSTKYENFTIRMKKGKYSNRLLIV